MLLPIRQSDISPIRKCSNLVAINPFLSNKQSSSTAQSCRQLECTNSRKQWNPHVLTAARPWQYAHVIVQLIVQLMRHLLYCAVTAPPPAKTPCQDRNQGLAQLSGLSLSSYPTRLAQSIICKKEWMKRPRSYEQWPLLFQPGPRSNSISRVLLPQMIYANIRDG